MYYVQVDPEEFQSRLSVLKDWMSEFSDVQKLALLQGITMTRLFFLLNLKKNAFSVPLPSA